MYELIGIVNPMIDLLAYATEEEVKREGLIKGTCNMVDVEVAKKLVLDFPDHEILPGSSVGNTVVAFSMLGGKTGIIGKIGRDEFGNLFEDTLHNTDSMLIKCDLETGTAFTFITPDSDRTFAVDGGASLTLNSDDLRSVDLFDTKILHFTAYQLLGSEFDLDYVLNNYEGLLSFDVADPEIATQFKDKVEKIIKRADIIFANINEAKTLVDEEDPEKIIKKLSENAKYIFLKLGKDGSMISVDGKVTKIDGFRVNELDSTGAGDMFGGVVLYAIAKDLDMVKWGKYASYLAGKIVEQKGGRLTKDPYELLKEAEFYE